MGLLDASEEPKSKTLRYAISGVALVLILGLGLFFAFRFNSEKHTVQHFMDAVVAGNFEQGYQIWKPQGSTYTYQDFVADWGKKGYYGPIESYRVESATLLKDANGIIVVVEISPFHPFPANSDPQSGRNREVRLFVARSDQSLSFPP